MPKPKRYSYDLHKQNALLFIKAISHMNEEMTNEAILDFLRGKKTEEIIKKKFEKDPYFGIFSHMKIKDIEKIIEYAEDMKVIERSKGIRLTAYGEVCIKKNEFITLQFTKTNSVKLNEEEEKDAEKYKEFLGNLNDAQKKAVLSKAKDLLCVAGAGTGKTTVLTKRIIHLVKNKGIPPQKILAITFTKKAKEHMQNKLVKEGIKEVWVHTFNSFGEYMIRRYQDLLYSKPTKLIEYKEKIKIVQEGLKMLNIQPEVLIKEYFSEERKTDIQKKNKFFDFINDCFTIKDYFKNNNSEVEPFYKHIKEEKELAEKIFTLIKFIEAYMKKKGLRDFSDQLSDTLFLFKAFPQTIPTFEHILIDEYQDINKIQKDLISKIKSKNIFCVGDPRQAIYGWRGAKVEFILDTKGKEVIHLTHNYRCCPEIVSIANKVIEPMHLPPLESSKKSQAEVTLSQYISQKEEALEVAKKIKRSKSAPNNIFVIARTNKQLEEIGECLSELEIPYTIKSEEIYNVNAISNKAVILATTHCVKGLEAKEVYVIGCTSRMFPCMKSDHKIIEYIKDYYNKKEEELRLLYVALTRAEEKLHISYYGKRISPFITCTIERPHAHSEKVNKLEKTKKKVAILELREELANTYKIPSYLILNEDEIESIISENIYEISALKSIIGSHKANRFGKEIIKKIQD